VPIEISPIRIKLGEAVYHERPYIHPQLRVECPRDFFGRSSEKEDLIRYLIDSESRQPVVVQGERRMGKTSMLKLVEMELREKYSDVVVVTGRLDLRTPQPATILFSNMIRYLCAEADFRDTPAPNDLSSDPGHAIAIFKKIISSSHGKTVVFIMDELDEFLEGEGASEKERQAVLALLNLLIASDLPVKFLYSIIRTQARLTNIDVIKHISEAKVYGLKPLCNNHEFSEMVRTLSDPDNQLNEANLSMLYRKSGGWPYFLKVILWYYVQLPAGPRRLKLALDMAAKDKDDASGFTATMGLICKQQFDVEEKWVVRTLANSKFLDMKEMARISPSLPGAGRRIEGRHYLSHRNNGYKFKIGLMQDWLRQHEVVELGRYLHSHKTKRFSVAFSFTSDHRSFVRDIARTLAIRFGKERILFDESHEAEFARVDLSDYLPRLYDQAELIVIVICENYYNKEWCRLEWNAIEKIIATRPGSIMPVRFDGTKLAGWPSDELASGYLDVKDRSPVEIAEEIMKRISAGGSG
jgi:hypothetical protein